jgi:hypothetical protein
MVEADWNQMRLAAAGLLVVYLGTAAIFTPRELRFLAIVEPKQRRIFTLQDILLQVGILMVLVPSMVARGPSALYFTLVATGFTVLWITAVWTGIVRSMYTYRLMLGSREQHGRLQEELSRLIEKAREGRDE